MRSLRFKLYIVILYHYTLDYTAFFVETSPEPKWHQVCINGETYLGYHPIYSKTIYTSIIFKFMRFFYLPLKECCVELQNFCFFQ